MKNLLLLFAAIFAVNVISAQNWNPRHPSWTDSHEANGFCWCNTTNFDHNLDSKSLSINNTNYNIVDVCEELESHPLYRAYQNGDAPYNDIQCGNGPANDAADEVGCPGRTDLGSAGCNNIGPTFDMEWLESRTRFGGSTTTEPMPTFCNEDAPIGETIALRKSGGDQAWISLENGTNNLVANANENNREVFLVEEHSNGCVALRSTSTNLYVQVINNSGVAIKAGGNGQGTWENFSWEQIGTNQVGFKSEFADFWIQANWNENGTALLPTSAARGNWETFDYEIVEVEDEPITPIEEPIANNDCGATLTDSWTDLLENGFDCWEKWIGVPHTSTGYPGASNSVTNGSGTPFGLENDPTNVYSIIEVDGENQLYITGEIYGVLTTLNEYSNYHLSLEFKWGEQKWEPRLTRLRDSGILYHANGEHGASWDVWKSSLEYQVQEGDLGDYIGIEDIQGYVPTNGNTFSPGGSLSTGGIIRAGSDPEFPNGEWNTLEIIVIGDRAIHYANGVMVNAVRDATWNGNTVTKGQIQIQSEGAELYYRNIRIKSETEFPAEDLSTLGWDGSDPGVTPTPPTEPTISFCNEDAPIGETIAFRKSGGDEKWITLEDGSNNLIADGNENDREEFLVELHPDGCIALKSISTDLYVQVFRNTGNTITANGTAPGTWEDFSWEQIGANQVGLKSEFSDNWIQASWDENNTSLDPVSDTRGDWETLDYVIIGEEPVEPTEPEPVGPSTGSVVHITKRNAPNFALDGNHNAIDGQNLYLWAANQSNINQQWIEIDRGNGFYSYQKMGTTVCIDGQDGGDKRQNVYLWTCNENNFNQQWQKVATGDGAFKLVKRNADGFAIDGGNGGENAQNVALWSSFSSSENLQWFITPVSSAKSITDSDSVIIYPVPVITTATITGAANATFSIYDLNGRVLNTTAISSDSETINLSNLESGLYYARIEMATQIVVKKIIKN